LVEDREADDDLQWRRVGHAALLAFGHVILEVQLNRVAALVAEGDLVLVRRAALRAHDGGLGLERIGRDRRAAGFTGASEMMEAFQVSALALPVSDGVADEFECRNTAKIRDRADGIEYRLQTVIVAFLRQHVHLEEPLVGILLY